MNGKGTYKLGQRNGLKGLLHSLKVSFLSEYAASHMRHNHCAINGP